jgi:hypothetical protein
MWLSLEESRMGLWGTRRLWRGSSPTRVHFTPNLSPQVLTGATELSFRPERSVVESSAVRAVGLTNYASTYSRVNSSIRFR